MTRKRDVAFGIFVLMIIGSLIYAVVNYAQNKFRTDLAKRIAVLSPRGGPPETIEGLKKAIALYEEQIELNVKEGAQTGVYWKILGIRLADKKMHRDALDAFERALYFNAEDPSLYFFTGQSAVTVAEGIVGFSPNSSVEREHFQKLAESAYLRAIQLDAGYDKPLFALGFLYTFHLDRPAEAIPLLERYLRTSQKDIKVMFVLARAYYMTESYDNAVELYDRIISVTKDPKVRAEAQNNKEIIRNLIYG